MASAVHPNTLIQAARLINTLGAAVAGGGVIAYNEIRRRYLDDRPPPYNPAWLAERPSAHAPRAAEVVERRPVRQQPRTVNLGLPFAALAANDFYRRHGRPRPPLGPYRSGPLHLRTSLRRTVGGGGGGGGGGGYPGKGDPSHFLSGDTKKYPIQIYHKPGSVPYLQAAKSKRTSDYTRMATTYRRRFTGRKYRRVYKRTFGTRRASRSYSSGPGQRPITVVKAQVTPRDIDSVADDLPRGLGFKISDYSGFANFLSMYEQYRIVKAEIEFSWDRVIQGAPASAPSGSIDTAYNSQIPFYAAIDYNSKQNETLAQLLERPNLRKVMAGSGQRLKISFQPKPMVTVAGTSNTMEGPSPWLDTANTNIEHLGLKTLYYRDHFAAGNSNTIMNELETIRLTVAFRGLKAAAGS